MNLSESVRVIKMLAKGIDPVSGEVFKHSSPYNSPIIIRSLYMALDHLPKVKKTTKEKREENRLKGIPLNSGVRWTAEARVEVAEAYKSQTSIENIAGKQERSSTAIIAELERQGLLTRQEAEKLGYMKHVL